MSDTPKTRLRAWLYERVSSDPTGRGLSVDGQHSELVPWCAREGWEIVGRTVDNDVSASRHAKKSRPGYQEIRAKMGQGAMDILVCWESSRAQRDLEAYVQTRKLCEQHNVLFAYKGRVYDLSRTDDRFSTGLDALLDERYADETRDRVLRGVRTSLGRGTPRGKIPFGYRREYDPTTGAVAAQMPDPATAPIVRELFDRIAAGHGLYTIASDLNVRGVPTPQEHRDARRSVTADRGGWTASKIRRQVSNPALAGYRVHRREITGEEQWPGLVGADVFHKVNRILADPSRRTQRGVKPQHWLSGILRCGVCGASCRRILNRGRPSYACHGRDYNNKACVCMRLEPVDAFVEETLIARLSRPDALRLFTDDAAGETTSTAARELIALEARLEEFRVSAESPEGISATTLARMEAKYGPLIAAARQRATPVWLPAVVAELVSAAEVEPRWEELPLRDKRTVAAALMTVTLHKDTRPSGSHGYNTDRIEIVWRKPG